MHGAMAACAGMASRQAAIRLGPGRNNKRSLLRLVGTGADGFDACVDADFQDVVQGGIIFPG